MGDVATLLGGADELYGRIGEADQSRPGALHGQADGREDDRDQCEPPGADLTTRCDHEPDYGGTRRLRPPTTVELNWGGRAGLPDVSYGSKALLPCRRYGSP